MIGEPGQFGAAAHDEGLEFCQMLDRLLDIGRRRVQKSRQRIAGRLAQRHRHGGMQGQRQQQAAGGGKAALAKNARRRIDDRRLGFLAPLGLGCHLSMI